ncbi:MAG: hypothetical protein KGN76_12925 [Acidobacteriota bacterium]|nr:hypothetical protein [Acidobacteriota bacterium]
MSTDLHAPSSGRPARRSEAGISLLETMIATGILIVVTIGLLPMGMFATSTTENQGHLAARATQYGQDKMEQLLALAWGNTTSDTTVFPATDSGGTGLAVGGSSDPTAPVAGYVDYLDESGTLLAATGTTPPSGWFYERAWQITSPATNLKQITVTVIVAHSVGNAGETPQATVTALKTYPF